MTNRKTKITMEVKLKELIEKCKYSVHISVNQHKDYYESVEEYIADDSEDIDKEVFEEMIKRDTVVKVQVYPYTPIGFLVVYHYDVEMAIDTALENIRNKVL